MASPRETRQSAAEMRLAPPRGSKASRLAATSFIAQPQGPAVAALPRPAHPGPDWPGNGRVGLAGEQHRRPTAARGMIGQFADHARQAGRAAIRSIAIPSRTERRRTPQRGLVSRFSQVRPPPARASRLDRVFALARTKPIPRSREHVTHRAGVTTAPRRRTTCRTSVSRFSRVASVTSRSVISSCPVGGRGFVGGEAACCFASSLTFGAAAALPDSWAITWRTISSMSTSSGIRRVNQQSRSF